MYGWNIWEVRTQMKTLKQVMDSNENFETMVKVAPNLRWDEAQKLEEWLLNCAKEWLAQKRQPIANKNDPQIPCTKDWCEGYALGWKNHGKAFLEELK